MGHGQDLQAHSGHDGHNGQDDDHGQHGGASVRVSVSDGHVSTGTAGGSNGRGIAWAMGPRRPKDVRLRVAMFGWEFPPYVAGGLGVHCHELARDLLEDDVGIDFYMPRPPGQRSLHDMVAAAVAAGGRPLGARVLAHRAFRLVEVDGPTGGWTPYGRRTGAADGPEARTGVPDGRRGMVAMGRDSHPSSWMIRDGLGTELPLGHEVVRYNQRLIEHFDPEGVDVIHCHDWLTMLAGVEIKRRTGIPLVVTVHSTEYDRSAGGYPQPWIEAIERLGVHEADRVIAVSTLTKRIVCERYGADPARVTAVPNGIRWEEWETSRTEDGPVRLRARTRAPTVLFLARITGQKSPLRFLEAAREVVRRRPDARFVVAGTGDLLPDCIRYTIRHGIERNVRFAGYVPDEELPRLYAESDVYVLPSFSEPFGISVLEAMAAGVPVVVSRTTGVGEALKHVLKVDHWDHKELADMVLTLIEAEPLRRRLARRGQAEARSFSWHQTAARTRECYESALDPSRGVADTLVPQAPLEIGDLARELEEERIDLGVITQRLADAQPTPHRGVVRLDRSPLPPRPELGSHWSRLRADRVRSEIGVDANPAIDADAATDLPLVLVRDLLETERAEPAPHATAPPADAPSPEAPRPSPEGPRANGARPVPARPPRPDALRDRIDALIRAHDVRRGAGTSHTDATSSDGRGRDERPRPDRYALVAP